LQRPASAASSLSGLGPEIAKGLTNKPDASVIVVASPLESDVPAPKGDELALKVASLVAGKLGPNARAHDQTLPLAAARGVASRSANLVFVKVVIDKGQLRVTADEFPTVGNPWDRIRLPPPPPFAHAFASAPVDAEIRTALTPVLLEQAQVHKAKHEETDVLAAACGDVDGDGGLDLLLVSKTRVVLGKLRQGVFSAQKVAPWRGIVGRAAIPMREPLGFATMTYDRISIGTTDRASVWLDGSLAPRGSLRGLPVGPDVCARAAPETNALAELIGCSEGNATTWNAGVKSFDAVSVFDSSNALGAPVRATVAREPNAKLHVRVGDRADKTIDGVGAQVALGDLDQDGVPELAFSADAETDVLTVASLDASGPRERLHFAAPDGIRALCMCPPEDRGAPALIAIVGAEVWLVR